MANSAHLFFMIAAPEGGAQTHLDALAKLSGILMDDKEKIYYRLIQKKKYFVLLIMLMTKRLKKKKEAQEQEAEAQATTGASANDNANESYVLAVTACPTGIAHTYMARDALKTSRKMGVKIKVETNGSSGIKTI